PRAAPGRARSPLPPRSPSGRTGACAPISSAATSTSNGEPTATWRCAAKPSKYSRGKSKSPRDVVARFASGSGRERRRGALPDRSEGPFRGALAGTDAVGEADGADGAAGDLEPSMRAEARRQGARVRWETDLVLGHRSRRAEGASEPRLADDAEQASKLIVGEPRQFFLGALGEMRMERAADKATDPQLSL